METTERTPTPREQLHRFLEQLEAYEDDEIFYTELQKRIEGDVPDERSLDLLKTFFNEIYSANLYDENGEVSGTIDFLPKFRAKIAQLALRVRTALEYDDFQTLLEHIETAQTEAYDQDTFQAALQLTETDLEKTDIAAINHWYSELITQVIKILEKLYEEPEFSL